MQYLFHLKLRTTCSAPLTKLATLLFKVLGLIQTSLELSSSKVVFDCQENKRKKREKRENCDLNQMLRAESLNEIKVRVTKAIRWLI